MVYRSIWLTMLVSVQASCLFAVRPGHNLFTPYDILLFKPMSPAAWFDFGVVYEGSFKTHGFQTDPDDRINDSVDEFSNVFRRRVEVLQLWHDRQNFCAALRGGRTKSEQTDEAALFNVTGEKIDCLADVFGDLHVPVNLMLSQRFALPYNLVLAFYLPIMVVELKNVAWKGRSSRRDQFTGDFDTALGDLERIGGLDLRHGWKETGIGDFATLVWWSREYAQAKEWLRNVAVGVRGGLIFPTAARPDISRFFNFPLGNDAGLGILFGGTLELGFGRYLKLGVDGEFRKFLGSRREIRIQTDRKQTDLLVLDKGLAHIHPGFLQHYTLYLTVAGFLSGLSSTLAYQHNRQHEDHIVSNVPFFDTRIANDAEIFQDWTTHSIIWSLDYSPPGWSIFSCVPRFTAFVKNGFNGKRAVVFDTAGLQINFSF